MGQTGGGAGFLEKTLDKALFPDQVGGQHLDGDGTVEGGIMSFVHRPHAAATNLFQDLILAQGLTGEMEMRHLTLPSSVGFPTMAGGYYGTSDSECKFHV